MTVRIKEENLPIIALNLSYIPLHYVITATFNEKEDKEWIDAIKEVVRGNVLKPNNPGKDFSKLAIVGVGGFEYRFHSSLKEKVGVQVEVKKGYYQVDGRYAIEIEGIRKIYVLNVEKSGTFYRAQVEFIEEWGKKGQRMQGLIKETEEIFERMIELELVNPDTLSEFKKFKSSSVKLVDYLIFSGAVAGSFTNEEAYNLQCEFDVSKRLEAVFEKCQEMIIEKRSKDGMGENHKNYVLRQKERFIKQELKEETGESAEDEMEEFAELIRRASMTEEAEGAAQKQLQRLSMMDSSSQEAEVARNYLNWLCDLPWIEEEEDLIDIPRLKEILDEDHYDLEKVKKKIIGYCAVRKIKRNKKAPIICLVGPPGVGKTSLSQSVGRGMCRKTVRASLGGVRDEAVIRGHRRTYVGALPGIILQNIKKARTKHVVFVLDEIDKMSSDFRGDPVAALLEVLDPEQNHEFSDHFLEVKYDLTSVLFMATANYEENIPLQLKDRMDIIYIEGYVPNQKLHIAKKFLVPKQFEENGLNNAGIDIEFSDKIINQIIDEYTNEAGVRNLERKIAGICRSVVVNHQTNDSFKNLINLRKEDLVEILGPSIYDPIRDIDVDQPGEGIGLARTYSGGEIAVVGSAIMKGKGKLLVTGYAKDVMQESAQVALTCAKRYLSKHGMDLSFLQKRDIHIQFEENAVEKDGPSGGALMTLIIISLLTGRKIKPYTAGTGEISFREKGKILPVGGIKYKLMGAHRRKIKRVFIPFENKKDLVEVENQVKEEMEIKLVKNLDEVIEFALI